MRKTVKYAIKSMIFVAIVIVSLITMALLPKLIYLLILFVCFLVMLSIPSREKRTKKMHERNQKEQLEETHKKIWELKYNKEIQELERDTKLMVRTSLLIKSDRPDTTTKHVLVVPVVYKHLFAPFNRGDKVFPAIDPLFEGLLNSVGDPKEKTVREFLLNPMGYQPLQYFSSFKVDPWLVSLTANEIMWYFIGNQKNNAEENWFILNTKPNEPSAIENLRMVDIRLVKNADQNKGLNPGTTGKYFLYCYNYVRWSIMGGGWIGNESKIYVPIDPALKENIVEIKHETGRKETSGIVQT